MSGYPGYPYPSNGYYNNAYPTYPGVGGSSSAHGYPEKPSRHQYDDRDRNYKQDKYDSRYESRSVDRDRGRDRSREYGYQEKYPQSYNYGGRSGGLPPPPHMMPPMGSGGGSVIMSQPKGGGFSGGQPRPWSSGLCDCTNDMKICMCVWCCSPFYQCCIMDQEFGEHCCNAWVNQSAFLAIRYKMRHEHNIEGSLLEDCMVSTFCGYCMMCQLLRENKEIKRSQYRQDRSLGARVESRAADAYIQRY